MARLISYPTISTVASGDLFPVTDISGAGKPLKNITAVNLQTFVNDGATLQRVVSTGNTYQAGPSDALWTWGTNAITANDTSFTSLLSSKRFKTTFIADGSYTDVTATKINFNDGLGNETSIGTNTAPSLSVIDLQWPSSSGTLALTTDIISSPWDTVTGGINYANGNVGIGTTTPSAKLDVNGDALINGLTVGQGAGTSALGNTVFGKTALNNITTGLQNVAIGNEALLDNTTGSYNVAIGYQSLENNVGNRNVAIGVQALERFEKADEGHNTAVGYLALGLVGGNGYGSTSESGKNNTAIGYGAGYNRVGGTNGNSIGSVFIGWGTKSNGINSENEIVIGTAAASAGSNTVVLGNDLITSTRLKGDVIVANGNVGIGTTSPNELLHLVSTSGGTMFVLEGNNPEILLDDSNGDNVYIRNTGGDLEFKKTDGSSVNMTIEQGGNVGIGDPTPNYKLDVNSGTTNAALRLKSTDDTVTLRFEDDDSSYEIRESAGGLKFVNSSGNIDVTFLQSGNVGIGTTSPASKLEVDGGDIEVDDSASGLILRSPDGTRYRIKVDNSGNLSATAV